MKGVAVPYIIALILGIAVIGLVGYWFFIQGGKFGSQGTKTLCDNDFLQWCIKGGGTLAQFITSNQKCTNLISYNSCDELVGTRTSAGDIGGGQPRPETCKKEGERCSGPIDTSCCSPTLCVQEGTDQFHTCKRR